MKGYLKKRLAIFGVIFFLLFFSLSNIYSMAVTELSCDEKRVVIAVARNFGKESTMSLAKSRGLPMDKGHKNLCVSLFYNYFGNNRDVFWGLSAKDKTRRVTFISRAADGVREIFETNGDLGLSITEKPVISKLISKYVHKLEKPGIASRLWNGVFSKKDKGEAFIDNLTESITNELISNAKGYVDVNNISLESLYDWLQQKNNKIFLKKAIKSIISEDCLKGVPLGHYQDKPEFVTCTEYMKRTCNETLAGSFSNTLYTKLFGCVDSADPGVYHVDLKGFLETNHGPITRKSNEIYIEQLQGFLHSLSKREKIVKYAPLAIWATYVLLVYSRKFIVAPLKEGKYGDALFFLNAMMPWGQKKMVSYTGGLAACWAWVMSKKKFITTVNDGIKSVLPNPVLRWGTLAAGTAAAAYSFWRC